MRLQSTLASDSSEKAPAPAAGASFRPAGGSAFPRDPYHVVLLAFPLLLLLISSNWIFSSPASIDPWVYYGYFHNFVEYQTVWFQSAYYGSRLSWIVPGYIVNTVFSPVAANYVLHLVFFYLATFSLYFIIKEAMGRRTALLCSVLFGSHAFFLRAIGSDYVDGAGITYFLLCMACLTASIRRALAWLWLALAGASCAAMFYANLFCVIYTPLIGIYYFLLARRHGDRPCLEVAGRVVGFFGLGALGLTVFLGVFNYSIGGRLWFYQPSIAYALAHVNEPNPWKAESYEWLFRAEWLVFPLIAFASSLLLLWRNRSSTRREEIFFGKVFALLFLGMLALMVTWEIRGIPVLQHAFYASYLIPVTFLAIGSQFGPGMDRLKPYSFTLLIIGSAVLNSAFLWGGNTFIHELKVSTALWIPLALGSVSLLRIGAGTKATLAGVAALTLCHATLVTSGYSFEKRHAARDTFVRISQSLSIVKDISHGRRVTFWYSKKEPQFYEYHALNSIYLWGYTILGAEFPALLPTARLKPGDLIVIPSVRDSVIDDANQGLASRMLQGALLARERIAHAGVSYSLSILEARRDLTHLEPLELVRAGSEWELLPANGSSPPLLPQDLWVLSRYPDSKGAIRSTAEGVQVTTVPRRWGYATKYGPLKAPADGTYMFAIHYRLLSGGVAFGALAGDESDWIAKARPAFLEDERWVQSFSVALKAGEHFWLLTTNDHPGGDSPSQFVIEGLSAYAVPVK